MKIIVTGGRKFKDREFVFETLDRIHKERNITLLIQGGANGADRLAVVWARDRNVKCLGFPANWATHGRAAGPIRNRLMLREKPDLVVAFSGGVGTAHMTRIAADAGVKVIFAEPRS